MEPLDYKWREKNQDKEMIMFLPWNSSLRCIKNPKGKVLFDNWDGWDSETVRQIVFNIAAFLYDEGQDTHYTDRVDQYIHNYSDPPTLQSLWIALNFILLLIINCYDFFWIFNEPMTWCDIITM